MLKCVMFAVLLVTQVSVAEAKVSVEHISARLVGGKTGALSRDMLDPAQPFETWNSGIGEGDAHEPSDDILVTVKFKLEKRGEAHDAYTLRVRDKDRKLGLAAEKTDVSPRFLDDLEASASVMVYDRPCGDMVIEVLVKNKVFGTVPLAMNCGE